MFSRSLHNRFAFDEFMWHCTLFGGESIDIWIMKPLIELVSDSGGVSNFCQKLFTLTRYKFVCFENFVDVVVVKHGKVQQIQFDQHWFSIGAKSLLQSKTTFYVETGNCVNLFFSFAHCVAHRCATRSSRKDEADKNNPWKRIKSWTERYFPSFSFFSLFLHNIEFSLCVLIIARFLFTTFSLNDI